MRIVAGRWRNRRLAAPKGLSTRPTSDKVRAAVFDLLGDVAGLSVADLFAGSGALGLEALSRGAERLVLIEGSAAARRCIRANIEALGAQDQAQLLGRDLNRGFDFLTGLGPFDLLLADPPYQRGWIDRLVSGLDFQTLAPGGRLAIEANTREAPQQTLAWRVLKQRAYGQTMITILTPEAR